MLSTLSEKVDPQHSALILVDVQNDFCAEGGAMHREGRDLTLVKRMMPRLERLLEAARSRQGAVRLDSLRLQYRPQSLPVRGLARAGQAPPQRRLCPVSGVRARRVERRLLPGQAAARRGHRHQAPLRRVRRHRPRSGPALARHPQRHHDRRRHQCVRRDHRAPGVHARLLRRVHERLHAPPISQAQHDATLFNIDQFFGEVATSEQIMACWPAAESRLRAAS